MHRRTVVRDAMISVLRGAATGAGQRVFGHRAWSLNFDELPAVRVFIPQEAVIQGTSMGTDGDRAVRMSVRVQAICRASDAIEKQVDDLSEQIEAAIQSHPTLGGVCAWCQLQSTDIDFEDNDKTAMVATLEYEAVVT
jgi:hypothetical protein